MTVIPGNYRLALLVGAILSVLALQSTMVVRAHQIQVKLIAGHHVLKAIDTSGSSDDNDDPVEGPSFIFEDSTGLFWIASPSGLYTYNEKANWWVNRQTDALGGDSPLQHVQAIAEDGRGRIWIQYFPGKLAFFDQRWRHADEIRPAKIGSLGLVLIGGLHGRVWMVSTEGLVSYDGSRWNGPFNPPSSMLAEHYKRNTAGQRDGEAKDQEKGQDQKGRAGHRELAWTSGAWSGIETTDGQIWLSGERKIWRFQERTGAWTAYPTLPFSDQVSEVFRGRDGKIRFGGKGAFAEYNEQTDSFRTYSLAAILPNRSATVSIIYADARGQLLIGTDCGNVVMDQRSGLMQKFSFPFSTRPHPFVPETWFPPASITAITEDSRGRIWLGSGEAIYILER